MSLVFWCCCWSQATKISCPLIAVALPPSPKLRLVGLSSCDPRAASHPHARPSCSRWPSPPRSASPSLTAAPFWGSRSWIPLPRNDGHGGGSPPPASFAGPGAVSAVRCAYPPLLLAVHLYPDSMTPAPTPTDFSAPKFTNFCFFCRADGMARCWPQLLLIPCSTSLPLWPAGKVLSKRGMQVRRQ